jgi:threonine dehydratase
MSEARAALRSSDPSGQLDHVLALPDHLRDGLWRVESARIAPFEASGVIVCGMGGSAIGADLAAAALGSRLVAPLAVVRGYELPPSTPADRAVLCSSYSGNTEETLACYEAADALGARRVGLIGFQIARRYVDRTVLVGDETVALARRLLWDEARVAAEPGAAAPVAALLEGAYVPEPDERVGLVICGGNADPATLDAASQAMAANTRPADTGDVGPDEAPA